jgi:uncharacterized protein
MKKIIIALLVFVAGLNLILGQELPEPPDPPRLVNDFIGLLSPGQSKALEKKLVEFNNINSSQIAIVIINDLQGYDIASYSQKLAQKWGIGQKKYKNGVIIVLKPKTATEKGEVNIDVGYGIEHLIPDITAKDIIDIQMIPILKNGDYYGGLNSGVDKIISILTGQFKAPRQAKKINNNINPIWYLIAAIFIVVVVVVVKVIIELKYRKSNKNRKKSRGRFSGIINSLLDHDSDSDSHISYGWSSGDGGSSSSSGGGGGSGGFSGFGGGSFGGGGASGSW